MGCVLKRAPWPWPWPGVQVAIGGETEGSKSRGRGRVGDFRGEASPGGLVRNADSWAHPISVESETLGPHNHLQFRRSL